jgi:hypothetical protein
MAGGGTTEQIRGRVEQTNEKGLKVDGRWFNWSQYSRSTVRPNEGDDVVLEIARGKFINDARIVGSGEPNPLTLDDDDPFAAAAPAPPRAAARRSEPTASSPPPAASFGSSTPNADRNTEIRRLALVKAAADYAAARDLDPEDVIRLAAQWEEWVVDRS